MAYPLISQCSEHSALHNRHQACLCLLMTDNIEQRRAHTVGPMLINVAARCNIFWRSWRLLSELLKSQVLTLMKVTRETVGDTGKPAMFMIWCPLWTSDVKCFLCSQDLVLYYFSAHWCPPCRQFTPMLKDFYEVTRLLMKIKIKYVFVRKLKESRLSLFLLIARLRTWPPTWR